MFQRDIAQFRIRKRLDNVQLGWMRDEVFGLHRQHSRDLRDDRRQLFVNHSIISHKGHKGHEVDRRPTGAAGFIG